jgi:serine phosphatase RsbU (regulator of sigma subunit)
LEFYFKAKNLAEEDKIYKYLVDAYHGLSDVYETKNNTNDALKYYKLYSNYRDSVFNSEKANKITSLAYQYNYEKEEERHQFEEEKKELKQEAEVKGTRILIYSFAVGFILLLTLLFYIYRGFRNKHKANIIISLQNKMMEVKQKEILDSITYAKRLQDAILPPLSIIKQYLPESFLLYKPKDIVAGDFYWMERAGDTILIAAADSTGHGVPGALVSVVCSNALNRTVKEFRITEPGKILDKVRELVLETFEKSENNVQDGMDISLCCINTKTKEMQWSGAYNSLWYIQKGEIHEVPADKQPIGKNDKPQPFNTHNLNLQKGDILYLFTDGYADQFGGPKGKKFKYKQMESLLLANAGKPMEEQKNILESTLNDWKGDLEQVDDILIIGIRV